ncbi:MAG: ATP-binding protein [Defluviitaleaceae bacterium]|nr:ATP-binding protein [Defluviitaleaceae bacterium]
MKNRLDSQSNLKAIIHELQKEISELKKKIALSKSDSAKNIARASGVNLASDDTASVMFLLDNDNKFIYASKTFLERTSTSFEDDLEGKHYKNILERVMSAKNIMRLSGVIGFAKKQSTIITLDEETDTAGITRTYSAHASPMMAEAGECLGIIVLLNDTTEITNAIEAEAQASASRAKFLATVSHELRTPMNTIIGISDIELDNDDHDTHTKSAFEKIHNSAKALLGIINDVLDLAQMQAGKFEISPNKYETKTLINDITRLNAMRIEDKAIDFSIKVSPELPDVLVGDELRIKQIANNILSNAIKCTEKGTVTIEIAHKTTPIGVNITFVITDTGQGMTKKQLKSLLNDEFSSVGQEANRKTSGTGLGMSITKNILDLMHGKITGESQLNKGSAFTIEIPQKPVEDTKPIGKEVAQSLENFKSAGTARAKIERDFMPYGSVLIVDDMKTNLFVASGLIKPYGITIDTAISGFEALDKINEGKVYDIIFMDHMMPELDGMETTKLIRAGGYTQAVIALTANAIAGQDKIFLENGFDDFVAKPIDIARLNEVLNKYIRDKQTPESLEAAKMQKEQGKDAPAVTAETTPIDQLRRVKGLDVEGALEAMSGLPELYVDTVKLSLKLLPERIEKMDAFLDDDIKAFTIEVHGLKSALKNIGATKLGNASSKLERAALEDDTDYCKEHYPPFKQGLLELEKILHEALPKDDTVKEAADKSALAPVLSAAKDAAESYDRDGALEHLSPHTAFAYGADIDKLLEETIFALEAFDCEGAANKLTQLEEMIT